MTDAVAGNSSPFPLGNLTNGTLTKVQACVFDAYGTLFDLDATLGRVRDSIGDKVTTLTHAWRAKQRELAAQPPANKDSDYWHITGNALDSAMKDLRLADPHLRARLMQLILNVDAFADAAPALKRLKAGGMRTALLSNATTTMLLSATKHTALYKVIDHVISTETIHTYKPAPAAYALASERLHFDPAAICYVSGNAWDAEAAASAGYRAVWIERGGEPARIALKLAGLGDLPALFGL
jgi:2-haloacid dehalogenase